MYIFMGQCEYGLVNVFIKVNEDIRSDDRYYSFEVQAL